MTVHVWQFSPTPTAPYGSKQTAAHQVQTGLDELKVTGDKTLLVHGDNPNGGRCVYVENVKIPVSGADIIGLDFPVLQGAGAGRVVTFLADQQAVTRFTGFEVIGGTQDEGAGLFASNSAVIIESNCIHDNQAAGRGGGIYLHYTTKEAEAHRSFIIGNWIYANKAEHGGGVALRGVSAPEVSLLGTMVPIVFVRSNLIGPDNSAQGPYYVYGGGVSVLKLACTIDKNEIRHNAVHRRADTSGEANGAGVCIHAHDQNEGDFASFSAAFGMLTSYWGVLSAQAHMSGNWIHDNHAASAGGGVALLFRGSAAFASNVIEKNISDGNGGGLYGSVGSCVRFERSNVIRGNNAAGNDLKVTSGMGGGVRLTCRSGAMVLGETMIVANTTLRNGGGVSVHNADFVVVASSPLHLFANKAEKGMGGGLCAEDFDEPYTKYKIRKFVFCDAACFVYLAGSVIEYNHAAGAGGGIAALQEASGFNINPTPIHIRDCIVRNNQSDAQIGGILIRRSASAKAGSTTHVTNSLIEEHHETRATIGLMVEDLSGNTRAYITHNTVRKNGIGLVTKDFDSYFAFNLFREQTLADVLVSGDARVPTSHNNELDGAATGERGFSVWLPPALSPTMRATYNNIVGHTKFGFAAVATANPKQSWWGAAGGPNSPGAADSVNNPVQYVPFLTSAIAFTPPPVPAFFPFTPPLAHSPSVPDCAAMKRFEIPGIPRRPDRPEDPPGTHERERRIGQLMMEIPDGTVRETILLPTGDLIVIGPGGEVQGFMTGDVEWFPSMAIPRVEATVDVPATGQPEPPPRRDELALAAANLRTFRIDPAGETVTATDVRLWFLNGDELHPEPRNAFFQNNVERAVIIEVNGWISLVLTPRESLPDEAFDLSSVAVTVSDDRRSMAVAMPPTLLEWWAIEVVFPVPLPIGGELPRMVVRRSDAVGQSDFLAPLPVPAEDCVVDHDAITEVLAINPALSAVQVRLAGQGTVHLLLQHQS